MRSIQLRAVVPTQDTGLVFTKITDFAGYPAVSADVRHVHTHPGQPQHTDWEVNFRRGIMRWTEREDLDADRLRVDFEQVDGDFAEFRGSWQLDERPDGCGVLMEVTYDFGIESLAGIMDPLAERVIKRSVCAVLADVAGTVEVTAGGAALTDLGELPAGSGIRIVKGEQ
jgi:ribosome-associated toxin RatA of RatAB toxin-antitoxin module